MSHEGTVSRPLLAEFLGSMLLAAVVIGSGIAAAQLSPNDIGLELVENTAATVGGLYVLITLFGPVSGAHFNPIVSVLDAIFGRMRWSMVGAYTLVQTAGCICGALLANAMFGLSTVSLSVHHRASAPHGLGEVVATFGLMMVIFGLLKNGNESRIASAVAAYIGAAYFFTSSTSFANPAITVGRMFSNTFAGIAPSSVPVFVSMQCVGGLLAFGVIKYLFMPMVTHE